jgi:DNA-binding NtrC family response regulator
MRAAVERVRAAAADGSPVLLAGEPGSGRARLARLVHEAGPRSGGPFVRVACTGRPEPLLERALFAAGDGALARAAGGTAFAEEIEGLPLRLQVRLLSFAGGDRGPRLVASSAGPLAHPPELGGFRDALFARLDPWIIELPPLRDRPGDILPLARALLAWLAPGAEPRLRRSAEQALVHHRWPGNVTELRNRLEGALTLSEGHALEAEDLGLAAPSGGGGRPPDPSLSLAEVERRHILAVLGAVDGHRREAARILGIGEATLYRKLERYGVAKKRSL